ncbi:MAG: HAD-IA family hydrolase [Planctomycetota bacterium]
MTGGTRIVVFDWGGVILRICRTWDEGCDRAGLPVREGSLTADLLASRQQISRQYETGSIGCAEFCDAISHAMNGLYSPDELRRIHDAWLIEEYPGIAELIEQLGAHDAVTTGMLSNTNHHHWSQQLRPDEGGTSRFPAARMLEHRHASHLLGVAKPDQAIFHRFETETGFRGSDVLFFDDLSANVDAARACGWQAEEIDHEGDTASQIAQHLSRRGIV